MEKSCEISRIDHRSLKVQKAEAVTLGQDDKVFLLDREPTVKMGQAVTSLERRGISTDRGDRNRSVTKYNSEKLKLAWENFKGRGSEKFLGRLEDEFKRYSLGALFTKNLREKAPVMEKAKPQTQAERWEADIEKALKQRDRDKLKEPDKPKQRSKSRKKDRGMEM